MQSFEKSEEFGFSKGLNLILGDVKALPSTSKDGRVLKTKHWMEKKLR